MNYLPSKKLVARASFLSLILLGWFSYSSITESVGNALAKQEENSTLIFINKAEPGTDDSLDLERITSWDNTASVGSAGASSVDKKDPAIKGLIFDNSAIAQRLSQIRQITANPPKTITPASLVSNFKQISSSDLNISEDSSKPALEKYGKLLTLALKPYSLSELPNEAVSALNYLDSEDENELQKINIMIEVHKAVANALLKMTVPSVIRDAHADLINKTNNLSSLDGIIAESITDPTIVATAVKELIFEKRLLMTALTNINQVFTDNNIVFKKADKMKIYINNAQ